MLTVTKMSDKCHSAEEIIAHVLFFIVAPTHGDLETERGCLGMCARDNDVQTKGYD